MAESIAIARDRSLIGKPQSRRSVSTPALILDLDRVEANIEAMAAHARNAKIALRPHAKTHKSIALAKAQLAAGAIGICVAKLGEAEALAAGGVKDLLITSPIVASGAIERLMNLRQTCPALKIVVDDFEGVSRLAGAAGARGMTLDVLIDIDIGMRRTGIAAGEPALALARAIARSASLRLVGIQAYGGHLMHVGSAETRRSLSLQALEPIASLRDALAAEGAAIEIVTGAGTGTFDIDSEFGLFSELQVGSYVFMDADYLAVQRKNGEAWPFKPALFVDTTVISNHHAGLVTTDAGLKAFATDGPPPAIHGGAPSGSTYRFMGDEQGAVILPDGAKTLPCGSVVSCIVPHCDPNVNLYDHYHVVRGDVLVDLWPVDARGLSS